MRAVIAVTLVPALSLPAAGQPSATAEQHRKAGYDAFDLGDFSAAIRSFELAYRIDPDPRVLYNLGLAYRQRHGVGGDRADLVRARNAFARFLELAQPGQVAGDPASLERLRELTGEYLEEIDREMPRRARVSRRVDGDEIEARQPPTVVRPAPRDWVTVSLLVGGGALALGGAVAAGLAWREARIGRELGDEGDVDGANAVLERADRLALTADVLVISGAAVAATGMVRWWLRRGSTRREGATVSLGLLPDGIGLSIAGEL